MTTARCLAFLPRFYHVYITLMATLARSGPIFRRRRRAVRTPPRCDKGIRTSMWETLLDDLGVEAEVNLFQREDDDILDTFLGNKWGF